MRIEHRRWGLGPNDCDTISIDYVESRRICTDVDARHCALLVISPRGWGQKPVASLMRRQPK